MCVILWTVAQQLRTADAIAACASTSLEEEEAVPAWVQPAHY